MKSPDDLMVDVVTGTVSETAAKVLSTEVAKALLEPAANEVGLLLGRIAGVVRFYAEDNLTKICSRWAESRNSRPVSEDEVKRVMPLLQMASMDSREELHGRWACLLEAVAVKDDVPTSFGACLSQMGVQEAQYLDLLWPMDIGVYGDACEKHLLYGKFRHLFHDGQGDERSTNPSTGRQTLELWERDFTAMIANLIRLGILEKTSTLKDTRGQPIQMRMRVGKVVVGGETLDVFGFSEYGKRFMRVISDHSK